MKPHISLEDAQRHLRYNPATGGFDRISGASAGKKVGRLDGKGYIQIGVCGRKYMAHRLAWWLHYREWPKDQIDHLNGVKTDNRICNLEVVDQTTNLLRRGRRKDNTSGVPGVCRHKATRKWVAYICVNKKPRHLGVFDAKQEAIAARMAALEKWGMA